MSVARNSHPGHALSEDPLRSETRRLRLEIYATRGDLARYIEELQRRRRELMDVKLQMRRHPAIVVGLGVAVAAALGGAVWKARRARQSRAVSAIERALSARGILGNVSRTFSGPPPGRKGRLIGLLANAGVPLGIALAKGLLRRGEGAGSQRRGL